MSNALWSWRPFDAATVCIAVNDGRWPPGKMCLRMKSECWLQYASYRSSGSVITCRDMGNAGCEIWGHVQYASYRSSGSDHLDGSDPAWFQSGRDRLEEGGQVLVPDRLEHLDRDHLKKEDRWSVS